MNKIKDFWNNLSKKGKVALVFGVIVLVMIVVGYV
jgi:flagellar biosynthesis/type III secretory pathway M-ring protein FliF/YscJ